jgi:hypothetical protein
MKSRLLRCSLFILFLFSANVCSLQIAVEARELDNFNDNTKTDWKDFTFVPGFGIPKEAGGQFQFELPGVTQGIFSGSQKTSETFELREGRTIEFRVDVAQAGAKDSFAILSFVPTAESPGTLAGYGLAKSTTDALLTKGINKYFVADAGAAAQIKNEDITLVLTLSARNGSVTITGKVLDKANNNAVLWERTVVDTPAADVLAAGTDSPQAPFITSGYFTLFCYADFDRNAVEEPYRVFYDNAQSFVTDTTVLDDFNDNTKTDWEDFTFAPGFGLPKEAGGQFQFELSPVTTAIFTGSKKTSRLFDLAEGERIEFQVDVVQAGAKDSFAVLAFIPAGTSLGTLAGYGLSKSTTDVLISKGIAKYFVADASATAQIKNDNITMVLTLTAQNGSVTITGKVLDKANNNAVLWQRTVVDTPAADVLAAGQDSPAAPFIAKGSFTLFCYADFDRNAPEDPYRVHYDNAIVSAAPVAANTAPLLSEVTPSDFASFLPASTTKVSFKVTDDKALADGKISITLNGARFTSTNGLTITSSANAKTATLGGLAANVNYTAILAAEDSEGLSTSQTLYFDTFAETHLMIEIEDFNFENGKFIDNPVPIVETLGPQANAYSLQTGTQGVDFNETRTTPQAATTLYRPNDPVRMQHSRDIERSKFIAAGGTAASVFDYDVADIAADEWMNYTRTIPAGSYEIYLRQAIINMTSGESVLELVTGDRTQAGATTRVLGSFLGERTGFQYRNFALTDGTGKNKIVVRLSGVTTLRIRHVTANAADGSRLQNYLLLVPVADAGLQRATIGSIAPAANSTIDTIAPEIRVEIQNKDTTISPGTIKLELNGKVVTPTITTSTNGAAVVFPISPLPQSGATNTAKVSFKDNLAVDISSEWSFVVTYRSLDPVNRRLGQGTQRGFSVKVVQAPAGSALANDLQRAEDQLVPNPTIPAFSQTNVVEQVINQAQDDRTSGFFTGETLVPGIDIDGNGTDDFAVEVTAWLELAAGAQRFGVVTDDGYKISSGRTPADKTPVLGFRNGGTANATFDFIVSEPGFYPFRMLWYERGGDAYAEWFSVDMATGERTLINDPNNPKAIKAYLDVTAPAGTIRLESAASVAGPYTVEAGAVIDSQSRTITIPLNSGIRFFRISSDTRRQFTSIKLTGNTITINFQ